MEILNAEEVSAQLIAGEDIEQDPYADLSTLAAHIHRVFQRNKDARRDSGVEEEILKGLRMVNKEYSAEELELISGGTNIYMPVGATKIRACVAWLKDILMSPKEWPFGIYPSTVPEVPEEIKRRITESITREFEQEMKQPKMAEQLAESIQLQNEVLRDMEDLISEEISKEALHNFKLEEKKIQDQLEEGLWTTAFSEFIEDFSMFPTAFLKGPLVQKKKRLTWVSGVPTEQERYVFINSRISPLDMYPAPSANTIQEGDLIEVVKTRPEDLSAMKGEDHWFEDTIDEVLESGEGLGVLWTVESENERAELEKRGSALDAYEDVYVGMQYHGNVSRDILEDMNIKLPKDGDYFEIEARVYGSKVVHVKLNTDPLLRRPYYAASFQRRPGSIWGISLPVVLDPIQRVCNACARALVDNMAASARPVEVVNINRLADDQAVEEITGGSVIQVTDDPFGSNSRAVEFFNIPSNASELLAIYNTFENKADDASMIPKYAYGGQQVTGAAATAAGLSMLMESASKGIKESVRHIDEGLIKPRIEYQFYLNMKAAPMEKYTGDIFVVAKGSDSMAIKGAQEIRRNEFLQIPGNPVDQSIMGRIGRAEILRVIARDLGLGETIVPSRFILRKQERVEEERKAQESEQGNSGLMGAKIQIEGQMAMHRESLAEKVAEREALERRHQENLQIQREQMALTAQNKDKSLLATLEATKMKTTVQEQNKNKEIALEVQKEL